MEPRLKTSKLSRSVPIPGDFRELISQVFNETYCSRLKNEVQVDGRIFENEVLISIGFLTDSQIRQRNLTASMDFDSQKQTATDRINICVEAIGAVFDSLLDESFDDLPVTWQKFEIHGDVTFLRTSTENFALEKAARELLGEDELTFDEGQTPLQ